MARRFWHKHHGRGHTHGGVRAVASRLGGQSMKAFVTLLIVGFLSIGSLAWACGGGGFGGPAYGGAYGGWGSGPTGGGPWGAPPPASVTPRAPIATPGAPSAVYLLQQQGLYRLSSEQIQQLQRLQTDIQQELTRETSGIQKGEQE